MSDHLPSNWTWKTIDELGTVVAGGTPSTKVQEFWNGDVAWLSPADLSGYQKKHISHGKKSISELGLKKSSAKLMPAGSILFSSRAPIGYVAIASNDISTNQGFKNLVPNQEVIFNEYVYYYLKYAKPLIEKLASGTTFKEISGKGFSKVPIPFPPLPEQHRIVAKIEELFSELDKGVESLKTAQAQLKTYRQAVLKAAFDIEAESGTLSEVCNKIQDGSHFSPKESFEEPGIGRFPYITAKNIRNNYMDFSKISYVGEEFHSSIYGRCNPEYGDVLLTKDGVNTGDVTLNVMREPVSLLSSVCLLKPKNGMLNSSYLKYYIQSPVGKKEIVGQMTGTAIKRIILKRIKGATIILPSLDKQVAIVQAIESRLSVCDHMEKSIEEGIRQSESLRQSILKRAFEGSLV